MIELRFFGGFEVAEVAELLGVSAPTVIADTRFARAFLLARIDEGGARSEPRPPLEELFAGRRWRPGRRSASGCWRRRRPSWPARWRSCWRPTPGPAGRLEQALGAAAAELAGGLAGEGMPGPAAGWAPSSW